MAVIPWWSNEDRPVVPGHGFGRKPSNRRFPRLLGIGASVDPNLIVNKILDLPRQYIMRYDQGAEGACVGFGWSWCMSILNRHFYAARKLYLEAQFVDPWPETPPEEGTDTYAGGQVLISQGHWRFVRGATWPVALFEGISAMRGVQTVDEIRASINVGVPVVLGINWYSDFFSPEWGDFGKGGKRWWIGRRPDLGSVEGGHCICCFGARDDIQAIRLVNSWGPNYPVVNMPYTTVERLLNEAGDAIVPTDRI